MKTLRMKFKTDGTTSYTLSLSHCREDLSMEDVKTAMEAILSNPVLTVTLTAIEAADIIERNVTELV